MVRHATPTKTESGPVFLGITSLQKGRIDLSEEHLSEADFKRWTRPRNPLALVMLSFPTKPNWAKQLSSLRVSGAVWDDAWHSCDLVWTKLDSRFSLYYYIGPAFQRCSSETRTIHGSTVERLALIEFSRFPIRLPPLSEQRAIAAVLGGWTTRSS